MAQPAHVCDGHLMAGALWTVKASQHVTCGTLAYLLSLHLILRMSNDGIVGWLQRRLSSCMFWG